MWVATMLIGYFVGALFAEFLVNRPRSSAGTAALAPRRLGDYLAPYVLRLQGASGLSVIRPRDRICRLLLTDPRFHCRPSGGCVRGGRPGRGRCRGGTPTCCCCSEAIGYHRQRGKAGRRYEVLVLARSPAAAIGILLNIVGGEVMVLAGMTGDRGSPTGVVGWVLLGMGVVLLFSSIAFWLDLSKPHGFKVRRTDKTVAA